MILLDVIFVTLSSMTSAVPSLPFFPLRKQTQHHRERERGAAKVMFERATEITCRSVTFKIGCQHLE